MTPVRELWFLDDARVFGGGQRTVLRLARYINEAMTGRVARVACPTTSELARRCRSHGIAVEHACFPDLGLGTAPRIALAVHQLRKLLPGRGADAVIVGASLRTQVYAHAATLVRRRPPIVHLMLEQDSAARLSARLVLRRGVVVLGDNAARSYRRTLPHVPVRTVNNVLLPEEFEAAARVPDPNGDGPPSLGVLARLIPEKGVLELVGELSDVSGGWSRLLVGGEAQDEVYTREVEQRLRASGLGERIRLLGPVESLGAFFGDVDVLVVPSVGNEGQPNVIIEALAHGRPVLVRAPVWSSDFEGLPVVPYRSSEDLGRSLRGIGGSVVDREAVAAAFGAAQMVHALEEAAGLPSVSDDLRNAASRPAGSC